MNSYAALAKDPTFQGLQQPLINGGSQPYAPPSMEVRRQGNQVSLVPHIRTFNSIAQWMSRTYRFRFDEALNRNYNSAKAMRNDAFIQGLYRKRMTPVTKSDFTIESEGPDASEEVNAFYKSLLEQTPQWHEFRRNVMECVWFGRYGVQMAFDEMTYEGRRFEWKGRQAVGISHWLPHLGDKITFTFDFYPCIRVSPIYVSTWRQKGATVLAPNDPRVVQEAVNYRWSEEGPVVVLDNPKVRQDFIISIFEIQDAPWDEPTMAGGIRGVGLRHYTFWNWDNKQEIVGWAMNYLEEFGAGGYTVVAYDGPEGLKRQQEAFADPMQKIIYVPIIPGTEEKVTDSVTRLEPATTGNDAIMKWAQDYFGADLTVLFLGHPLNAKAGATGLGSEASNRAADDLKLINRSDAEILDVAMTHECLPRLKDRNDPGGRYTLKFVSTIRGIDKQAGMTGADTLYKWGGKIPKAFAYMLADVPMLKPDEEFLQDPAHAQQEMQMQAQQVALGGGADTSYMERGSQHLEAVDGIFSGGNEATLESARKLLNEAGVPEEDVLPTLAAAVSAGKIEEHDVEGGVHYTKPGKDALDGEGRKIDQDAKVASYSVETDPSSKWTEETGPISGKPRWRNNETGRIQYKQPGTGRHVQAVDRSEKNGPGMKLDQGKYGVGVGLLPGKGLATGVVEDRVLQLAREGGKSLQGEGVLSEVMHVDKRLMKAQAISLAAKLGLQIDSKTSKTQALAHIENTLRNKAAQAKGGTVGPDAQAGGKTMTPAGAPGVQASGKGDAAPLLAMAEKGGKAPDGKSLSTNDSPSSPDHRGHVAADEKAPEGKGQQVATPAQLKADDEPSGAPSSGSPTTEGEAVSADSPDSIPSGASGVRVNGSDGPGSAETAKPPVMDIPAKSTIDQVRDIAKSKHAEAKNAVEEHNSLIRSAIDALRSHDDPEKTDGIFTRTGKLRRDKLKEADYNAIPGFKDVANDLAGMFSGILDPNGSYAGRESGTDSTAAEDANAEKLMEMLREGEQTAPKLQDFENQAFQQWYDSHPGQGDAAEPEKWDNVEFDTSLFGDSSHGGESIQGDTSEQRDAEPLAGDEESLSGSPGAWGNQSYPAGPGEGEQSPAEIDRSSDPGSVEGGGTGPEGYPSTTERESHPSGVDPNAQQGSEAGSALSQTEVPQDALPERSGSGEDTTAPVSEVSRSQGDGGFMEQAPAGRYQADDLDELAGQSFTNDKGLSIDVSKDEDGTWSVGKRYGLSAQAAANYMNELGAEKAQGLFSSEVTAQAPVEKAKEKWEWAKPTTKQEAGELPGMKDTFAPGMFAAGSAQREQAENEWKQGGTESASDVLNRVKASPNQPQDRDWEKYAYRFGVEGEFHHVELPTDELKKNLDAGHLRSSNSVDSNTVDEKAKSGEYNPVVITKEPGKGSLIVDGNHSLQAALKNGEKTVKAVVSAKSPLRGHVAATEPERYDESKDTSDQRPVYFKGDAARLTGKVDKKTGMYEARLLEGHRKGETVMVSSKEMQAERTARKQMEWKEQQADFSRLNKAQEASKPSTTQKAVETLKAGMAALQGGKTNEQGASSQQERSGGALSPSPAAKPATQSPATDEGGAVAGMEGTAKAEAEDKEGDVPVHENDKETVRQLSELITRNVRNEVAPRLKLSRAAQAIHGESPAVTLALLQHLERTEPETFKYALQNRTNKRMMELPMRQAIEHYLKRKGNS